MPDRGAAEQVPSSADARTCAQGAAMRTAMSNQASNRYHRPAMQVLVIVAAFLFLLVASQGCDEEHRGRRSGESGIGGGGSGGSSSGAMSGEGAGVDSRGCTRVADDDDCFYNYYSPVFCSKDQAGISRCSGWTCASSSPIGVEPGVTCQCSGPGDTCLTSPSGPWLWCCGTSCVPGGDPCSNDTECCSGSCGTNGRCDGCLPVSGNNPDGNSDCDSNTECCSKICNSDYGVCAFSIYP